MRNDQRDKDKKAKRSDKFKFELRYFSPMLNFCCCCSFLFGSSQFCHYSVARHVPSKKKLEELKETDKAMNVEKRWREREKKRQREKILNAKSFRWKNHFICSCYCSVERKLRYFFLLGRRKREYRKKRQ